MACKLCLTPKPTTALDRSQVICCGVICAKNSWRFRPGEGTNSAAAPGSAVRARTGCGGDPRASESGLVMFVASRSGDLACVWCAVASGSAAPGMSSCGAAGPSGVARLRVSLVECILRIWVLFFGYVIFESAATRSCRPVPQYLGLHSVVLELCAPQLPSS